MPTPRDLIGIPAVMLIMAAFAAGNQFGAAPATAGQSEETMGKRFVVIEHANPTLFDIGAEGPSVGDVRVFSNDLYDADNAKVVGADQGFCVRTLVGKRMECTWSNIFENGTIVTQGPGLDAAFHGAEMSVAITGGTGEYVGASGELTISKFAQEDHQFTFTFDLA